MTYLGIMIYTYTLIKAVRFLSTVLDTWSSRIEWNLFISCRLWIILLRLAITGGSSEKHSVKSHSALVKVLKMFILSEWVNYIESRGYWLNFISISLKIDALSLFLRPLIRFTLRTVTRKWKDTFQFKCQHKYLYNNNLIFWF